MAKKTKKLTYRDAGVDIDEGARLVRLIRRPVRSTFRPGVIGEIGGFGALFSARFRAFKDPVLVSATDGVGTKLAVAFKAGRHDTIGVDLVAMSVNDIVVSGAEPLFFLDYFATSRLDADVAASVVKGIARGCRLAGCALTGGETAEMPGLYRPGEYDLAGFAVGVVDKKSIIDGSKIRPGARIIGLASSGLHSNGYSLARKVLFERLGLRTTSRPKGLSTDVATALLRPTRIYVKTVLKLLSTYKLRGLAHITGGGFIENIPRVVPEGMKAVIKKGSWPVPPVFDLIQTAGRVSEKEMLRTFNCGIGMALFTSKADASGVMKTLKAMNERAFLIGEVKKKRRGDADVEFV